MAHFFNNENQYYTGEEYGGYQFISLYDIVNQFMVAYVGEDKIIPRIKRLDVAYHAQRAAQELSFDTFKSFKSQQIDVPATLQMILPHDYVNYTKLSWVDSSGIKHPLYPTKHTNNPKQILQDDDGEYFFGDETNMLLNPDFDPAYNYPIHWRRSQAGVSKVWDSTRVTGGGQYFLNFVNDTLNVNTSLGRLEFGIFPHNGFGAESGEMSRAYAAWQRIDVTDIDEIDFKASAGSFSPGSSASAISNIRDHGTIRVGITSTSPDYGWADEDGIVRSATNTNPGPNASGAKSPNRNVSNYNVLDTDGNPAYAEWNDGTASEKEIENIDVSAYDEIWVYVQCFAGWLSGSITSLTAGTIGGTTAIEPTSSAYSGPLSAQSFYVDSVSVIVPGQNKNLTDVNVDTNSSTWNNYKSTTPSENTNDDYEDDTYWPYDGRRYGLEPSHAQVNGSFFIDQMRGKIHFSSNISGKTVILDYISDSLGTDGEMQIHKFAEEAMYKWIAHAIISTSSYGQALAPRFNKEKFAAVRKAKLRLSNIKLEELTQILRGKSKWIKH